MNKSQARVIFYIGVIAIGIGILVLKGMTGVLDSKFQQQYDSNAAYSFDSLGKVNMPITSYTHGSTLQRNQLLLIDKGFPCSEIYKYESYAGLNPWKRKVYCKEKAYTINYYVAEDRMEIK